MPMLAQTASVFWALAVINAPRQKGGDGDPEKIGDEILNFSGLASRLLLGNPQARKSFKRN